MNAVMADWAGIVLAGGRSRRMGRDKAELAWRGASLLDHARARLAEFGARPVIVSGKRPVDGAIPDGQPGQGPLGGLHSVLSARPGLEPFWLMMIPVDMPETDTGTLQRLAGRAVDAGSGAVFDSGPLPMALAPGAARFRAVEELFCNENRRALHALVDRLELVTVPAEPGERLDNINVPEDYRALSRALSKS